MNNRNSSRQVRSAGRPSFARPQAPAKRQRGPRITINVRAVVAVIILMIGVGWWWQFFRVSKVTVTGNWHYAPQLVQAAALSELGTHWWGHNLTTIDTRALRRELLGSQTQLSDVAITRQWPGELKLSVTERQPNLIWQTGGQTYLLDNQGVIILPLKNSNLKLVTVEDTTNLPAKAGDRVVPASFVSFCLALINLMPKQTGLSITKLQVPETTSEVYAVTNAGYSVKFDTSRSVSGEVGDLVRVLAQLKSQNQKPSQYIDLRIENRAYYK